MEARWSGVGHLDSLREAYTLSLQLEDQRVTAETHLFEQPLAIVPYSDEDQIRDSSGELVERGDDQLAKLVARGELAFALKGQRPFRRSMTSRSFAYSARDELGLADTHLSVVVGIQRDGAPGVATVTMPQNYANGRVGDFHSPPLFLVPRWPSFLTDEQVAAFQANVRTYLVGFHSVGTFSFRYIHGDQLAAHDRPSIQEHAAQMVRAIAGDEDALKWFREAEHQFYCSELAFVAFGAGLEFPLNAATMVPLVGNETWLRFQREVEVHDEQGTSAFSLKSRNKFISSVDLAISPPDLLATSKLDPDATHSNRLAFLPMTTIDIVDTFLRHTVPREEGGEERTALVQAEVLAAVEDDLIRLVRASGALRSDSSLDQARALVDRLQLIVETRHSSYPAFRKALEPLLESAKQLLRAGEDEGVGLFATPSLFHLLAEGKWSEGQIGLRYVGHGVPYEAVSPSFETVH